MDIYWIYIYIFYLLGGGAAAGIISGLLEYRLGESTWACLLLLLYYHLLILVTAGRADTINID